jgi:tRNA pseudouridine32 synthase/23S rRNA pseudouridine746 synthase
MPLTPEQASCPPASSIVDDFVAPECADVLRVLYQDDDILLINKPSGLLSLSGKNPLNWDSVHYRLLHGQDGVSAAYANAKLPHRLDFGTSGLMVAGLNDDASKQLNAQFQTASIQKHYVAMLEGWLAADHGEISAPIAKDKSLFPRVKICHQTGKPSLSEYRVLERLENPRRTLVEFTPHSGRTHQLRIHSLEIGHPILGCDLYPSQQSQQMADRLLLHASQLIFEHPSTGEPMHWQCPSPF